MRYKIGIIFCSYNNKEYLLDSIDPWINCVKNNLGGDEFLISAVSVPFKHFPLQKRDSSYRILDNYVSMGLIKELFLIDEPMDETAARDLCLESLKKEFCDIIILVDNDEIFTVEQICNIIKFIKKDPYVAWYRLCLKNYVGDGYLSDPFTPPRIFRNVGKFKLFRFIEDNLISYLDEEKEINPNTLGNKTIPKEIAFVIHKSWPNDLRSKDKCNYQMARWGDCSYKWDEETGIQLNEDYYLSRGLVIPKILNE